MAALTDLSDLINRQTGGNSGSPENCFFSKQARIAGAAATAQVAGRQHSLWRYDGTPGGGAIPTVAAIPDRTTTGAIPFTAPGGGREKHVISAGVASTVAGIYFLYDRLFHIGGLNSTLTTAQTVQGSTPSPALTRNTGGNGNMIFYEIYSALGVTSRTLTVTYTNEIGTTGRTTTINIGAASFSEATRMQRIPLATGDFGVRAVDNVQLNGSTTTAGDFGITIANPIAFLPVGVAGGGGWRDWTTGLPGIPQIHPDACLAISFQGPGTGAPEISFGFVSTVEK